MVPSATLASPTPARPQTRRPLGIRWLGLSLATGVMLWLCHFPVAWGWLAWIALVPVLTLVRAESRGWWLFLCAWSAGLAYFFPAISWMSVAHPAMAAGWVLLSTYCSLYFPLAIWIVRRLERNTPLPLVLTFPVVWTALEFFRCFFGTGFSWYLLAHTQHNYLALIQISDLGGAFGVSFLIALVNVVLMESVTRLAPVRRWLALSDRPSCIRKHLVQVAVAVALVAGTVIYGIACMSGPEFDQGPHIALLQANLDQRLRVLAEQSDEARGKIRKAYGNLNKEAGELTPRPDLIVWPETSYPFHWTTLDPKIDLRQLDPDKIDILAKDQKRVRDAGRQAGTAVLLGINTDVHSFNTDVHSFGDRRRDKINRFNSALLLDADGKDLKRYDKLHRVPFGEYVPFRDWLPFMNAFSPYDWDYDIGIGDGLTRFTLGQYKFGVLVCYEDTDPALARGYGVATEDGPPADFLLNISNDGWFDGTAEHEEHLAISRFRAIESRRSLARAVNMGVSAVVDSNGRVLAPVKRQLPGGTELWAVPDDQARREALPVGQWHEYKRVNGILDVRMPIDHRTSLYAVYGDWLPYTCWVVVGAGLLWAWTRRRRPSVASGHGYVTNTC
jgi:apolipoprotein N-acyltransferase